MHTRLNLAKTKGASSWRNSHQDTQEALNYYNLCEVNSGLESMMTGLPLVMARQLNLNYTDSAFQDSQDPWTFVKTMGITSEDELANMDMNHEPINK